MKKVNLNFAINTLDGIKANEANKMIAGLLLSQTKGDSIKFFDWATKLHQEEEISIDDSDFETLYNLIKETESLTVLGKGPVLKYLTELKRS